MTLKELIRGLQILEKYTDANEDSTAAEHDIIYLAAYEETHAQMTEAE